MKSATAEVIPTVAGTACAGGIYAGRFFVGTVAYALIVASKAEGELERTAWNKATKKVAGALSVYDGLANTEAMAKAGSPLAKWARDLRIGGLDDWYLPSRGELLLAYAAGLEGADAFERDWYWSSTQHAGGASYAWFQYFGYGYQSYGHKYGELRARAVRRLPL